MKIYKYTKINNLFSDMYQEKSRYGTLHASNVTVLLYFCVMSQAMYLLSMWSHHTQYVCSMPCLRCISCYQFMHETVVFRQKHH